MLVANDTEGERVTFEQAVRGGDYVCPDCDEPVIFKCGRKVVHHFAHRSGTICVRSTGESRRHMEMKAQMAGMFRAWKPQLEVLLLPDRRADMLFAKTVVECQASTMTREAWDERTRSYNEKGFGVLWVWDLRLLRFQMRDKQSPGYGLLPEPEKLAAWKEFECRVPDAMLYNHRVNYGSIYALTPSGHFQACHFVPVTRYNTSDFGGRYSYRLKVTRTLELTDIDISAPRLKTSVEGHQLVEFGEGVWFTTRARYDEIHGFGHRQYDEIPV